ncbi:MAG: HAD family hydrolase [Clostridia bacterium]|nr:HAD family hydrolase [Deltaproteobacteria bacterium]
MSFEVVLFDVDGTLVDSVDAHARAWQEAFDHFGKQVGFDALRAQIGKGGDQLIPHFLSAREREAVGDKLEKFRGEIFKRQYLPSVRAFPKTREVFERLSKDGVKLALASSAKGPELKHYIEVARIGEFIDASATIEDAEKSKPSPDIFQAALAKLGNPGVSKARVVGDSPWDVQAAQAANLACVTLLSGGFPEVDLKRAGAIAIFRDPSDILESYQKFRATPALGE